MDTRIKNLLEKRAGAPEITAGRMNNGIHHSREVPLSGLTESLGWVLLFAGIFGIDWPGVSGLKNNALLDLGLNPETVELMLHKNASRMYKQERKNTAG